MDVENSVTPWAPQSGRTSAQMRNAPESAVFVWCNGHFYYPKMLARQLGRSDLIIISPDELAEGRVVRGRKHIVIDHAAELNFRAWSVLRARGAA